MYCSIVAITSIAQIANLQWFECAENKYKSHNINMLNQMRLNGTIVAAIIDGKKEDPATFMQ